MRDVNHGGLEARMQVTDFCAHGNAQLGVKVGKRLVKQKQLGLTHDGTADGHTLALPARKLGGFALQQLPETQEGGSVADLGLNLAPGDAQVLQAKRHVVVDTHVRVQGVRLEHHGAASVGGAHTVDVLAVDHDIA